MKFYDCSTAPSPRRVRIFLAEKGITVPTIQVDLRNGEQFSPAFRARKVATDEFVVRKPRVQPREKMLDSRTAASGQRGDLLVGVRPGQGMPPLAPE